MIKQLCICIVYDHFVNEDHWRGRGEIIGAHQRAEFTVGDA